MGRKSLNDQLGLLLICAGLYLLLNLPFQATGIHLFTGVVGPKNALPAALGLLLGPVGALGTGLGAAVSGLLLRASGADLLFECLCALFMGCGSWLLWYSGRRARPFALKRWRDLGRMTLATSGLAACCGLLGLAFGNSFLVVFLSFLVWNALLGVPILIQSVSILGVLPVCPKSHPLTPDMDRVFPAETASLEVISDLLDELCLAKRLERKKSFQVQSCIEELLLRILAAGKWNDVSIQFYVSDSVCLYITYMGMRYNPIQAGRGESREDLMGLLLIRQRALRASYQYRRGENRLHIVL